MKTGVPKKPGKRLRAPAEPVGTEGRRPGFLELKVCRWG
jgi:hypothetical protein